MDLPAWFVLAPGLGVRLFAHDVSTFRGPVPCWTWRTEGLAAMDRSEVSLTLVRPAGGAVEPPADPVSLLAAHAPPARRWEPGMVNELPAGGFLRPRLTALGYMTYIALEGAGAPPLPAAPALTALLLTEEERALAWRSGLLRIVARLGLGEGLWPCPPHNDPDRPSVASPGEVDRSLLGTALPLLEGGSAVAQGDSVRLTLPRALRHNLGHRLQLAPFRATVAIALRPDPEADALLAWRPGEAGATVHARPGSSGTRPCGAFCAFTPALGASAATMRAEDGFVVRLGWLEWRALRVALFEGREHVVRGGGRGGAVLEVRWG